MSKGDIVIIPFPYTDLSDNKLRPCVIVAESNLDLTVCFITTQIGWQEPTDVLLKANLSNSLKNYHLFEQVRLRP